MLDDPQICHTCWLIMPPYNCLSLLLSSALLIFNVQYSDSVPARFRSPGFTTRGAVSSYIAAREAYAFMPRGAPRSEFDIGRRIKGVDLLESSKDHGHASGSQTVGHKKGKGVVEDDLKASNRRRQGATVRLLVIDTVPAMMLHKTEGPSIQVNMQVLVRVQALPSYRR